MTPRSLTIWAQTHSTPLSWRSITSIRTSPKPEDRSSQESLLSKRRVVVTGLGIVSPVGNEVAAAWSAILAGRSGIGPGTRLDTTTFPTHFGGEIRELDIGPYLSVKDARRMDAFMQYGVI